MKFFKKTDFIVIIAIFVISLLCWLIYHGIYNDKRAIAEIYYYSERIETIDLNSQLDKVFSSKKNKQVVFHLYKDGSIAFEKSDCPDKVCVHTGKINMAGQSAACLPNGIIVKIVPEKENNSEDIDAFV